MRTIAHELAKVHFRVQGTQAALISLELASFFGHVESNEYSKN